MLTPTYVNRKYFFYPIGNTPAVNLFCDVRPQGEENIKILLLACGDVRNILFSLWSEDAHNAGCKFGFVVCDFDPAVLGKMITMIMTRTNTDNAPARNVFLFTFIAKNVHTLTNEDDGTLASLWNIYYHFLITSKDLAMIQQHAKELFVASESMSTWQGSSHGAAFRFLNDHTLEQVRRFWASYAEPHSTHQDTKIRKDIKSVFDVRVGEGGGALHGLRAAGAHWMEAVNTMSDAFMRFWETGVVAGNDDDVSALHRDNSGRVNPLMSISSDLSGKFAVHYGSDPLLGFHLAEAFDVSKPESKSIASLVQLAKAQFYAWCHSFGKYSSNRAVSILIHCGEAVSFAHELQNIGSSAILPTNTHTYVKPWSGALLNLKECENISHRFDIIDTSNVIDHVGILNVLPAVVPLLKGRPSSILYNETLLKGADQPDKTLETLLHANVTTLSMLFGITPVGHVIGSTTDPAHVDRQLALVPDTLGKQGQFRMRFPWCPAFHGDRAVSQFSSDTDEPSLRLVREDPHQLASFFMQTYLSMFREAEDISIRMEVMMRKMTNPLAGDLDFYTRLTLVGLIALANGWQRLQNEDRTEVFVDRVGGARFFGFQAWRIQP